MANFFLVICPYVLHLQSLAYFAILKAIHSSHATDTIYSTAQVIIEVYTHKGTVFIQPQRVENRANHGTDPGQCEDRTRTDPEREVPHGLLYEDEQMALLVQRVSGDQYDHYFFPLAAGVGFSYNPYVWDKEIDPHSGVLHLAFGLGTRAVDRVQDDYTRIVALNAPFKRPEKSEADSRKYSQREVDVVDLQANRFATYPIRTILSVLPDALKPFFVSEDREMRKRAEEVGMQNVFPWQQTFEGLFRNTDFIDPGKILLKSDGPIVGQSVATKIDRLIYVSSSAYTRLGEQKRYSIARLIGRLTHLSSRQKSPVIMLVGPGRWGTSTPAMGVPVAFKEINTVSIIVELAVMHEGLVPDMSLGTHFFNDLVEMDMMYFAVFPDREENEFNGEIFEKYRNLLTELCPDAERWADTVKVLESPTEAGLSIYLHADSMKQFALCYMK